jgi:single-strand DNA-binding protein
MNLNKTQIIGRLTRDPELKALPSGIKIASFSMATNRVWKNEQGEKQEAVEYHNIIAFGRQAELIAQYVAKGDLFFIEGRNQTRSWEDKDTGKKLYRTEVVVENMQFAPRSGEQRGGNVYKPEDENDLDKAFPDSPSAPTKGNYSKNKKAPSYPKKKQVDSSNQGEIEYPEEDINPEDIPF